MKTISFKRLLIYSVLFIILFIAISFIIIPNYKDTYVNIKLISEQSDDIQIFFANSNEEFSEEKSIHEPIEANEKFKDLLINIPENLEKVRLDFGTLPNNVFKIDNIKFINGKNKCLYNSKEIYNKIQNEDFILNQMSIELDGNLLICKSYGNDPFILVNSIDYIVGNVYHFYFISLIVAFLLTIIIYKYVYLKDVYMLIKSIFIDRKLLWSLGINDFKVKYAGSYFGILWAFVQPICTIMVFCFVFYYLRSAPVSDVPFALWLTTGMIPWFFFSEAWNSATTSFIEYSYLVKKVVFKIDILPIVKIISAFFVHLFFVLFMIFLYTINGFNPEIRMLGIVYYMFCMTFLVVGISFITASVVIFFKDLTQIMSIFLQILMWMTPIMWSISMLPDKIVKYFELNPMYYIVQGYRNCMIGSVSIIPDFKQTIYFWFISVLLFFIGISLFRRLKVHFADVL